jgi:hypothetical protein
MKRAILPILLLAACAAFAASLYDIVPFALTAEEQRQVAKGDVVVKIVPLNGTAHIITAEEQLHEVMSALHRYDIDRLNLRAAHQRLAGR